jgi:glycosyltransferase involved in cell wall biosynthesis
MKIAMIGQKGIPSVSGGVERHVEELGARLAEKGHKVTIYNRKGYAQKKLHESRSMLLTEVFTIKNKFLEAPIYSFLASIKAVLDKQDIVHYHAIGPSFMAFLPRLFGKKVVVTVHGLDWQRAKWGRIARAYLKICEKAAIFFPHKTVVVSNKLEKYFDDKYGKRAKKAIFIPNGVNTANPLPPNLIKEYYGLEKKKYILFLARLVPEKGCHYLLEAFERVHADVKLVIAGGSSHSEDYCKKLSKYASEKVIFTGEVKGDLLNELYCNALFYILPSEIEGLPISLLEAMSYGICPLVSDIEENLEVISKKGICGFQFRSVDTIDLQLKLQYMISHPDEVVMKGEWAKKCTDEFYDWDDITQRTENIYRLLCGYTQKDEKQFVEMS